MLAHEFAQELIAVDIGNSRIKLGRFRGSSGLRTGQGDGGGGTGPILPEPGETLELPLANRSGEFDGARLAAWSDEHIAAAATWLVSSVHRGAAEHLGAAVRALAVERAASWPLRNLTYRDVPLTIAVDAPDRLGIDRLLAALGAEHLRARERAAIIVDLGTAITVDLVTTEGAFAGGAILPGLSMSARALEEQTDALPHVAIEGWREPPTPLGKATVPAIESGLFWGAVGAVRELVDQLSRGLAVPPDVFVTGGNARFVAEQLVASGALSVHHVPHLLLSGIALAHLANSAKS
jgi:type III pantothenate kinase